MIGKILALFLFITGAISNLYESGAYAHGKKETRQGKGQAVIHGISFVVDAIVFLLLYLDW
jgi:hypothetical protein